MYRFIALTTMLVAVAGLAAAAVTVPGPEIDASSGATAVALISGGMLVLRARRKK